MGVMHSLLPFSLQTHHKMRAQLEDAHDNWLEWTRPLTTTRECSLDETSSE
jgi:hypothetical protein